MYNSDIKYIVKSIHQVMMKGGYSNIVVQRVLKGAALSRQEENSHRRIVHGVIEHWLYLDYLLSLYVNKTVRGELKCFLMAALYELHFNDGRPAHVVVNRYVDTAKRDYPKNERFVNAILRRSQREKPNLTDLSTTKQLSLRYSFPEWLISMWQEQYGDNRAEQIMAASLKQRGLYLRVNRQKSTAEALIARLAEVGIASEHTQLSHVVFVPSFGSTRFDELPSYTAGLFTVQDLSAALVGELLDIRPGQDVLDMCSAPGGKASDAAERLAGSGHLTACDIHVHKLTLVEGQMKRLALTGVDVVHNDARQLTEAFVDRFDRVLLDAPCSGLGTLAKKPEIKYRKRPSDLASLLPIQQKMLDNAARYVKMGGNLVYSTCTLNREENQRQIERFLTAHDNFKLIDPQPFSRTPLPISGRMVECLPGDQWSDGFFIAVLTRIN